MNSIKEKPFLHEIPPFYPPSSRIKVNTIKRNSQKKTPNTSFSTTISNPFHHSPFISNSISSYDHNHKPKSPLTFIHPKYSTLNSTHHKYKKRQPNTHNAKSPSSNYHTLNIITKRKKPHSQEKVQSFHNNITFTYSSKRKITKSPLSIYTSSIHSRVHTRTSSSTHKHPSSSNNNTTSNISTYTHNTSTNSYSIKKIKTISSLSKQGITFPNIPKQNQDSFFISSLPSKHTYIGICDGHGPYGHLVSSFLKEYLPSELSKHLHKSSVQSYLPNIFDHTYLTSNSKLSNNTNIDTNFSGSTAISILFPDNLYTHSIFIANVGDSRAIVVKQSDNGGWMYECLSRDHKPCEKDEAMRIESFGGRIERFKDKEGERVGPLRVWLKKEGVPGLAMTRSFGDQVAATVGVICEPEVKEYVIKEEDKCVVIASDGLWEYVSNERCVEVVKGFYLGGEVKEEVTEVLYKEAVAKWEEYDVNVDDITIIVVEL